MSIARSIDANVDRIGNAFDEVGDVLRLTGLGFRAFCFRNPVDVKQIYREQIHKSGMVFSRVRRAMGNGVFAHPGGEGWKLRRRVVSKAFARRANASLLPAIVDCVDEFEQHWDAAVSNDSPIDLQHDLNRLIANYAFRAYFSTVLRDRVAEAGDAFHEIFAGLLDPLPLWLPTAANRRFKAHVAILRDLMNEIVSRRLRDKENKRDVLTILLEHMSPLDAVDQMVSIFSGTCVMVGSLTWMLYSMAKSQDAQDRLVSEISRAAGNATARLTDMPKIPYARMVFNEAVRLYPAAWMTPRVCQSDFEVNGYRIPRQSFLFPMVYYVHRHPDYWQSPDEFNPDRFAAPHETDAFLPFGSGPRMCPGAFLAPLIAEYLLVRIYQRYRLSLAPSTPYSIRPTFGFELSPSSIISMHLERISDR